MYKMNSSVVCPVCSLASCDCSNAVVSVDASASIVSVPLKSCILCFEDKEESGFSRYAFRCGCKDKEKYMCDDCVGGWLKCGVNKNCPNCRHKNFASVIRNMILNFEFSFHTELPVYSYDGSFNDLSFTQRRLEIKPHLKTCFDILVKKNVAFYDEVVNNCEDSDLTRGLQTFFNLFEFLKRKVLSDNFPNDDDRALFNRFFILDDEPDYSTIEGVNGFKLHDFMSEDYEPTNNTYWIMVNAGFDKWDTYKFTFETNDSINELIENEITDNIHYHNQDTIIRHLRPEMRSAFHGQSPFWSFVRDDEMSAEIIALINRDKYHDFIRDNMEFVEYIYRNAEDGFFDCLDFDDFNNNFDDWEGERELWYMMEYDETINLA